MSYQSTSPLLAQVLTVLDNLGCATITKRTFFNLQRLYLQPTVFSIWKRHQQQLITRLKDTSKQLILGGVGRLILRDTVPSMGHTLLWNWKNV